MLAAGRIGASVVPSSYFRPIRRATPVAYDAHVELPAPLQSYLAEPKVEDVPVRVWRDWALLAIMSVTAFAEVLFRNDEEWLNVSRGWHWASLVMFFVAAVPAILFRRTHPLPVAAFGFAVSITFGVIVARLEGEFGGLWSTAIILITLYTVFRWGSGRDGVLGLVLGIVAGIAGNLADPTTGLSDWIGGFIVLSIPLEIGLIVRYQRSARDRAISEAKSLERSELARELHDTVAHHVSAIAVQAQAGQAMALSDPERALGVLAVIEEAASRTLIEMRSMVGTLRDGAEAELAPQQGLADLHRLAEEVPGDLKITVVIGDSTGSIAEASQSAMYRIARESITNAVRHARNATEVTVAVNGSAETVTLSVVDDGAAVSSKGSGYGLLGMAERAEMLGGSFNAGPAGNHGWKVAVTLPRASYQQ